MIKPGRKGKEVQQIGSLLGIGIQLTVTILAFAALGWWLDNRFETAPWFLLAGLIFGATGGMISFIRTALKAGGSRTARRSGHDRSADARSSTEPHASDSKDTHTADPSTFGNRSRDDDY